jgi:steroid 5-alpha reductase family enzyme
MYGNHGSSVGPKVLMTILHAVAVAGVAWLLFGGMDDVASWVGTEFQVAAPLRRWLLLGMSIIYFLRLLVTTFVMAKRRVSYGEALIVSVWIVVIHGTMTILGGTNAAAVGPLTWLGVALYIIGSYLNTGSEYQRLRWKQAPEHIGKLYTEGLFKYAMHINYFGDLVLLRGSLL